MRRVIRSVVFILALAVAGNATVNNLFTLGPVIHPEPLGMNLMVMVSLRQHLNILRARSGDPETYTVAFMGDSTVIAYPEGQTVNERLQQAIAANWAGPGHIWVESLSSLAMTPAGFFLVQDEISDARPDVAILTANLSMIRDPMPPNLKRPELAGWVRSNRIYDTLVAFDLYKFGVTTDRLLLYKFFVAADLIADWLIHTERQARLGHLRAAVEAAIAERTGWTGEVQTNRRIRLHRGAKRLLPGKHKRATSSAARQRMGEVMAGIESDHWAMEVIQRILDNFADAEIATVLYVPPINTEHLKRIGAYDEAGLLRSLETLEQIAHQSDAVFADLHDLLPDAYFIDAGGHFTHAPPYDGPALVAEALAPYVMIQMRALAQTR